MDWQRALILISLASLGADRAAGFVRQSGIRLTARASLSEAILAHYRRPYGYDLDRFERDLSAWTIPDAIPA
ncbi:hypothetical protein [Hyphomicrobium sp. CS1BSMeth3]|uniref:hypothetical protein n=1 Tax=Hyphomicrobium sp. CS1BSMeth3 TaxID=1892844 RepID=UPI000930923C|nr:hypothetical protein [Hyphomicrobium sp. CS1BSMeth3]